MKYLFALIASTFLIGSISTTAFAESQTTITTAQGLTDAQKAELASAAAKMVAENASGAGDVNNAKRVKEWVDIGTQIGSGIASTARELGVAANDFVKTPVGKMTAAIIVWHFMGSSIIHIAFGMTWLLVVGSIWYFLYRRTAFKIVTTEYEAGKGPSGAKRTVEKKPVDLSDGQNGTFIVGSLIIAAIGIISIATF